MSKFNLGDKVRVNDNYPPTTDNDTLRGKEGTVTRLPRDDGDFYRVEMVENVWLLKESELDPVFKDGDRVKVKDNFPNSMYRGKVGILRTMSPKSFGYPFHLELPDDKWGPAVTEDEIESAPEEKGFKVGDYVRICDTFEVAGFRGKIAKIIGVKRFSYDYEVQTVGGTCEPILVYKDEIEATKHSTPWDPYDDQRLGDGFERGTSIAEIAKALGRSEWACVCRLERLQFITKQDQKTWKETGGFLPKKITTRVSVEFVVTTDKPIDPAAIRTGLESRNPTLQVLFLSTEEIR